MTDAAIIDWLEAKLSHYHARPQKRRGRKTEDRGYCHFWNDGKGNCGVSFSWFEDPYPSVSESICGRGATLREAVIAAAQCAPYTGPRHEDPFLQVARRAVADSAAVLDAIGDDEGPRG